MIRRWLQRRRCARAFEKRRELAQRAARYGLLMRPSVLHDLSWVVAPYAEHQRCLALGISH